jgi:hypothetical protein
MREKVERRKPSIDTALIAHRIQRPSRSQYRKDHRARINIALLSQNTEKTKPHRLSTMGFALKKTLAMTYSCMA